MEQEKIFETTEQIEKTQTDKLADFENDTQIANTGYSFSDLENDENKENRAGNVFLGVIGALLFSIPGAILYFLLYQVNVIAAISAFVMLYLAVIGYRLFSKCAKTSRVSVLVAVTITVLMICVSEYACLAYEIFKAYKEYGITILDAIIVTPEFLKETEIMISVFREIGFCIIFAGLAVFSYLRTFKKAKALKK